MLLIYFKKKSCQTNRNRFCNLLVLSKQEKKNDTIGLIGRRRKKKENTTSNLMFSYKKAFIDVCKFIFFLFFKMFLYNFLVFIVYRRF